MKRNKIILISVLSITMIVVAIILWKRYSVKSRRLNFATLPIKGNSHPHPSHHPHPSPHISKNPPKGLVNTLTLQPFNDANAGNDGYYMNYSISSNMPNLPSNQQLLSKTTLDSYPALQANYDATYTFTWDNTSITNDNMCNVFLPNYISLLGYEYGGLYSRVWTSGEGDSNCTDDSINYNAGSWSFRPTDLTLPIVIPFYSYGCTGNSSSHICENPKGLTLTVTAM